MTITPIGYGSGDNYDLERQMCVWDGREEKAEAKAPVVNSSPSLKPAQPAAQDKPFTIFGLSLFGNVPSAVSGLIGCGSSSSSPDVVCASGNPTPTYPEWVDSDPREISLDQLETEAGVDVTWRFRIRNCDSSVRDLRIVMHFPDGDESFTPDDDGYFTITKNFTTANFPQDTPIKGDLYYYDPVNDRSPENPLYDVIRLGKPQTEDEPPVQYTNCDYSQNPSLPGGIVSSHGSSAPFGEPVTFEVTPRECDMSNDDLLVEFQLDGVIYSNAEGAANPVHQDGDRFYIEHVFSTDGNHYVSAFVTDDSRAESETVQLSTPFSFYVTSASSQAEIYARSGDDGFIPRREVTLTADYTTTLTDDLTYTWAVRDPEGNLIELASQEGRSATFIPETDGIYSVTLTITSPDLTQEIIKPGQVTIYEFPEPQVVISGDQSPSAGDIVSYSANLIAPQGRELGPEDDGATCTWSLTHIDPATAQVVTDIAASDMIQNCADPVEVTFPSAVTSQTNYFLEVSVVGGGDSYEVPAVTYPITLYPDSADLPRASFAVAYHDDGAVPFRTVTLQGGLSNSDGLSNLTYEWEIADNNGALLASQPSAGLNTAYEFMEDGLFFATLNVYSDGDLVSSKTESIVMYRFPMPEARISINDNNAIYQGVEANLTGLIARDWTEDQNAQYSWRITHVENNGSTTETIVDLDPSDPLAQAQSLLYTFNNTGTYTVELTITGMNGNAVAYTKTVTELVDVYTDYNGLPSAVINDHLEYSYNQSDVVANITGHSDDENATYSWSVTRPDGQIDTYNTQTIPSYAFDSIGNYFFKLEITSSDGVTKNFAYRNVEVYPETASIPSIGISAPYAANIGDRIDLTGNSDDPLAAYEWTITPPSGPVQTISGQSLSDFELDMLGDWDFRLTVTSGDGQTTNVRNHAIQVYGVSTGLPTAVISGNLRYSYHLGDSVTNIRAYSDAAGATFNWLVTRPDGVTDSYPDTPIIPSYTFDVLGDYDFKLEVVASDGTTKNYEIRSIGVYPVSTETPQAGIIVPEFAYNVGEPIPFMAENPDESTYSYTWIYGDGTTGTGAVPIPKTYSTAGTKTVKLIVARLDDTSVTDEATIKMTIVPESVSTPSFRLNIPYAAEEGLSVPMSMENLASPSDWTVTWQFGDGTAQGSGLSVNHTYASGPGVYRVIATLTSNIDPGLEIEVPHNITIVPYGNPVPSLSITPTYGAVPFSPALDATASYTTAANLNPGDISQFIFDCGGGNIITNTSGITSSCTFYSAGTFPITLTVEDGNGATASVTAYVTPYTP